MSQTPPQPLPTFLVVGGRQKEVLMQLKKIKNKQPNHKQKSHETF